MLCTPVDGTLKIFVNAHGMSLPADPSKTYEGICPTLTLVFRQLKLIYAVSGYVYTALGCEPPSLGQQIQALTTALKIMLWTSEPKP